MVQLNCDCKEHYATDIDSWDLFIEVKSFLEGELNKNVFFFFSKIKPLDFGKDEAGEQIWHYTQRLFKCKICGCLWSLSYPDFPAHGFVGKYSDGKLNKSDWK
jgi:hypothetical protein